MTTTAQPSAGKAIFVDGPSMNCMKRTLGIELFDCRGLYSVLCGIGRCRSLACEPVITINPRSAVFADGLAKQLSGAGFLPLQVESRESADDEALRERIQALDPAKVGELVLVTSDKDFIPTLLVKHSQGIRIFWVSTLCQDRAQGRHSLSQDVLDLFKEKVFEFIDLQPHIRRISLERKLGAQVSTPSNDTATVVTVRLYSKTPSEHRRLVDELVRLKERFKGLTFDIVE